MVTGSLKSYTDENIIELIESIKAKTISYNLNDLKAVLAEVNNRRLEGDYTEVLGELIREKILNGDIDAPKKTADENAEGEQEKPVEKASREKKREKIKTVYEAVAEQDAEGEERYPVLTFMTGFLKVLGWIMLAVSVIYGLYSSVTKYLSVPGYAIGVIFSGLLTGTVLLILCYTKAESISVKLEIEKNLRKIAQDK